MSNDKFMTCILSCTKEGDQMKMEPCILGSNKTENAALVSRAFSKILRELVTQGFLEEPVFYKEKLHS